MSSKESLLKRLEEAVINGDEQAAKEAAEEAANIVGPTKAINEGLAKGMSVVGEKFHNFEIFLPQVMLAADAMKAGLEVLKSRLSSEEMAKMRKGVVVIGTVYGDIHDIGKNLVVAMLESGGFEVHDLGVDVHPKKFVEEARKVKADIIGMSSLLTSSLYYQKETVALLQDMGIRSDHYVIVGGASVTTRWTEEIAADGWGKNAEDAPELCRNLIERGRELKKPVIKGIASA